jgi:DNA-binding winged helix-turn-helix (wHTH) protein/TolB-like protein
MANALVRHLYSFGPFVLDPSERLLARAGQPVPITPKAFDMLVLLVERRGHLIEKKEIIRAIWPDSFVEEGNLCVTVSLLRKTLGSDNEYKYIETVPKRGYRFVAEVSEVSTVSEPAPPPPQTGSPEEPRLRVRHDSWLTRSASAILRGHGWIESAWRVGPATVVTVLLLSILSVVIFSLSTREAEVHATKALPIKSLAVLPFQTLGQKANDEYLGLGIADAIITKLGTTRKIVMRSTRAVQKYTNTSQDPQSVGRELGVDAVLDGRIQRENDRIRLTVQLIRVADGVHLWADTFDENFTNIFTIEDKVSAQVAQSISLELTGEEQKTLAKRPTNSSEAYRAYLKGRYFWNERTEDSLTKGLAYFRQAVDLDSSYSEAYSGIADSYAMLGLYTVVPPSEAFPRAKAAAMKALEMDESLADAHATLGFVHFYYDWDGPAAEKEFNRALNDNRAHAMARSWHAFNLAVMGQFPEAIAEAMRAEEADPLSPIISTNASWVLCLAGQYERAVENSKKAMELDPNFLHAHFRLGNAYEQEGQYELAIVEYQKAVPDPASGDTYYQASLGHAYAMAGKIAEARKVLAHLQNLSAKRYVAPYAIGLIYAGLGDRDQAFEWLNKACADHSTSMAYLKVDPALRGLRSDPRFARLLRHPNFQHPLMQAELQ